LIASALALAPVTVPVLAWARPAPVGFADLVEQVNPAVVQIVVQKAVQPGEGGAPQGLPKDIPEGPLKEFSERFFGDRLPGPGGPGGEFAALGSGFVIDPAGVIVTNNHVVAGAGEISVRTKDGEEYRASLVGGDEKTDLAVLRVDPKAPLPAIVWGDSDALRVGDWVVAVGNPFGLGGTVTAGIVSARGRDIGAGPYDDFLQIDASINTGNSGGPLFDVGGKVVGVNTAIFSPNGGSIGIGFAIPAGIARDVVAQLRDKGTVARGWLGVMIQPVTAEIADSLGLKETRGALVTEVAAASPAAKAGLRQGDVVLSFDGKPVATLRDLSRAVAGTPAGTTSKIEFVRDGKVRTATTEIAAQEAPRVTAEAGAQAAPETVATVTLGRLGLTVAPLGAPSRNRAGSAATGVVVAGVEPGKGAAEKGLRVGDVITSINQKPVASPKDLAAAVEEASRADRKAVLLLVERDGEQRFVAVELADA
jgi:serine protease Do